MTTDFIPLELANAAALAIVHSLWQGLLVAGILTIIVQLGIVRNSRNLYWIHLTGLLTLMLATIGTFYYTLNAAQPFVINGDEVFDFQTTQISNPVSFTASRTVPWQNLVLLVWVAGVIIAGTKNLVGGLSLLKVSARTNRPSAHWEYVASTLAKSMGINTSFRLRTSGQVLVPFVLGVFRPVIVFPSSYFIQLTPGQIEAILLHELEHIRRNDFLINIIQLFVESLLFYNPVSWWLSKKIHLYREYNCDDRVISQIPNSRDYLEALYSAACIANSRTPQLVALFNHKSELIMRIRRMSQSQRSKRNIKPLIISSAGTLAIVSALAFGDIDKKVQVHNAEPVTATKGTKIQDAIDHFTSEFPLAAIQIPLSELQVIDLKERRIVRSSFGQRDTHPPSPRMLELPD